MVLFPSEGWALVTPTIWQASPSGSFSMRFVRRRLKASFAAKLRCSHTLSLAPAIGAAFDFFFFSSIAYMASFFLPLSLSLPSP